METSGFLIRYWLWVHNALQKTFHVTFSWEFMLKFEAGVSNNLACTICWDRLVDIRFIFLCKAYSLLGEQAHHICKQRTLMLCKPTHQNSYPTSHLTCIVTSRWLDIESVVTIDNCWQHGDYWVGQLCCHCAAKFTVGKKEKSGTYNILKHGTYNT